MLWSTVIRRRLRPLVGHDGVQDAIAGCAEEETQASPQPLQGRLNKATVMQLK